MEENTQEIEANEPRVYELGYLLVPGVGEENVAAEATALKDTILSFGALPISEEYPRLIELAYEMETTINNKKEYFNNGYFGWFKFELDPEKVSALHDKLALSNKLIRFLLIKTVRASTMASKRPYGRDFKRRTTTTAKSDTPSVPVEINKEEIDREIDALVAEDVATEA